MVTKSELNNILDICEESQDLKKLSNAIGQLRVWGRDSNFCVYTMDEINFKRLSSFPLDQRTIAADTDLVISLYATISNVILGHRRLLDALPIVGCLNNLLDSLILTLERISSQHSYTENLVSMILPPIRFIYLVTVDKNMSSKLSLSCSVLVDKILSLLDAQLLLLVKDGVNDNLLIVVDVVKIGYSLVNFDQKHHKLGIVDKILKLIKSSDLSSATLLNQYANYISFVPLAELRPHTQDLIKLVPLYVQLLEFDLLNKKDSDLISVLHYFNQLASLAETLYLDNDIELFKKLRHFFIPTEDKVPEVYTLLMGYILQNNSKQNSFGFNMTLDSILSSDNTNVTTGTSVSSASSSSSDGGSGQMVKNLALDFYLELMGNNIEKLLNEVGLLLSMDFVKLKGDELKVFGQDEVASATSTSTTPSTGLYPLHYNVVEENKKLYEKLPDLTEEEKEEEWERLMDTFDKMKKNGMIKMVQNPLDPYN